MSKNNIETETPPNGALDAGSKIEAIKNLIFGENIQAYDSEFDSLKKEIAQKRDELKDFIEETRKELNGLIDNLSTDLNIRITELEGSIADKAEDLEAKKVDKKALGQLLVKLGNQISE
ncbi:fructose 1,6-bisphosphatase [Aquimarina agarilytica]|uniref:fructose 1,6-bisphosphatase n=1 Tax=Aquimarina agarilytica TaxID=1087449 RepID=UPI000289A6BF|nr:fructose 1,6-bisphosphatase [Aquimarina agarilytica]